MAVSLAPSPPPPDLRGQAAAGTSASAFSAGAVPMRPPSATSHHGRHSPGLAAPPMAFPFSSPSPALSYPSQAPPTFVMAPQPHYYGGYQHGSSPALVTTGSMLPPPISQPGTPYGYGSAVPAFADRSQHFQHPPPNVQPYYQQQRQQFPHPGYAAFSGVTQAAAPGISAPVDTAAGAFHPYRRPPNAARPSPTHARPPEPAMFTPPMGPADLARLRRDSAGSTGPGRPPRDTQPFPGRIRTQSSNSNTSAAGVLPRGAGSGSHAGTPTPPRSMQPSPRPPSPRGSAALGSQTDHRNTASRASAAAAVAEPPAAIAVDKKKGHKLVGGLRRAFSMQSLNQTTSMTSSDPSTPDLSRDSTSSSGTSGTSSPPSTPPSRAMGPPPSTSSKMGRLGMSRFNRSTDNISISSTVSSASMMIRKLGQIGKRSSLSGISAMFGGKDRDRDEADTLRADSELGVQPPAASKLRKRDKKKSSAADPEVSHITAELDRVSVTPTQDGLTPAEALAKRHQQIMAQQDEEAAIAQRRHVVPPPALSESALHEPIASAPPRLPALKTSPVDLSFVDAPAPLPGFSPTEEVATPTDETPRQSLDRLEDEGLSSRFEDDTSVYDTESEFEVGVLDPVPGHRLHSWPPKSILKNAQSYNQEDLIRPQASPFALAQHGARIRANSYDVPSSQALPTHHADVLAPADVVDGVAPHPQRVSSPVYSHPSFNVSAPLLRRDPSQLHLAQRSASTPQARRCSFAQDLSVHSTWPAAVYDRRGEPATCNRLTPALAQRIKEELNDYKMTEMNVHAHSRIYTHFFV